MEKLRLLCKDFEKIMKLPVARNSYTVTFLRSFGGHVTSSFLPLYMQSRFPDHASEYATLNGFALSMVGSASGIIFGIIADKA